MNYQWVVVCFFYYFLVFQIQKCPLSFLWEIPFYDERLSVDNFEYSRGLNGKYSSEFRIMHVSLNLNCLNKGC